MNSAEWAKILRKAKCRLPGPACLLSLDAKAEWAAPRAACLRRLQDRNQNSDTNAIPATIIAHPAIRPKLAAC
jgi:hypothetical protein